MLSQPQQSSLPVLYGVIYVLCDLGCASIAEILFPHLETLANFLQAAKTSVTKNDVSRLQEAILVSMDGWSLGRRGRGRESERVQLKVWKA